ncbi:unnamed protein product [Heterosigma akashiwo]
MFQTDNLSSVLVFLVLLFGLKQAPLFSTAAAIIKSGGGKQQQFVTLANPAPGAPFHHAFPVHDLDLAKDFYQNVLGCVEGRSSTKWQDFSLYGHQIVAHWVGNEYRCQDYYNPVDGDEVPVPHFGLALTVDQWKELAQRVTDAGIQFIVQPHLRFEGMPGEQYTMFFKDPSGNNLEFKAMTTPENLFAKYNVPETDGNNNEEEGASSSTEESTEEEEL